MVISSDEMHWSDTSTYYRACTDSLTIEASFCSEQTCRDLLIPRLWTGTSANYMQKMIHASTIDPSTHTSRHRSSINDSTDGI